MKTRQCFFKSGLANLLLLACGFTYAQSTPGVRDHLALTFDRSTSKIFLYGGSATENGKYVWRADTWSWDGKEWLDLKDGTPGNITSMSAVYSQHNKSIVMFGGVNPDKGDLDETWEWKNNAWKLQNAKGPSKRLSPAMAYDPEGKTVILFSGCAGNNYPTDTWEWDESKWIKKSDTGPPEGLCRASLFYDPVRKKTLLFGGVTSGMVYSNQMWEWDGSLWKQVHQGDQVPPGRSNFQIAYDEKRKKAVLFGGHGKDGLLKDLWEWDGYNWNEIKYQGSSPGIREVYGIAYHPLLNKILFYGGRIAFAKALDDFWSWDGTVWEKIN
jgi:hypothetical protein